MATPEDLEREQQLADSGGAPSREADEKAAKPMGGIVTRSLDGWSVDARWLNTLALNDDRVLQIEGYAPDLKLYDNLLDDDVAMSTFQQRRLDVISCDWEVEPGHDDRRSRKAADHMRETLKSLPWDEICDKMLFTRWYGYGVAEAIWEIGRDGLLKPKNIYVPDRSWFAFTNAGELRMRTHDQPEGQVLPDRKFWTMKCGGSHDAQHYGVGLAHWVYWPVYFKKNVLKFWALFLEKFGMPTMLGKFPQGWENEPEKIGKLLDALGAVGTDAAVAVPIDAEVSPMEAARSGSGASSYAEFLNLMNEAMTRVVLSQTMTSTAQSAGIGSSQAEVHKDKGLNIAQADSDLLHESFQRSIATWMTEWNFPGAATPRIYRKLQDEEDLNTVAERDGKLHAMGWERTDESMRETYGEGFQRKEVPEPLAGGLPGLPGQQPPANDDEEDPRKAAQMKFALQFAVRDPQPLYIQRKLTNGGELLAWARAQGFTDLMPESELHATQIYCRNPVDWFAMASEVGWVPEEIRVQPGGPRGVEPLGDDGVIVLQFASWDMDHRHRELLSLGATHGHDTFWPHVTFARSAAGVEDLSAVEPFRGALEFGPEIWEPLDDDGALLLTQPAGPAFSAETLDQVDRLVLAMSADGQAAISRMVGPLRDSLKGLDASTSPEALRLAILEAVEGMDYAQFAATLADPMLGLRTTEQA